MTLKRFARPLATAAALALTVALSNAALAQDAAAGSQQQAMQMKIQELKDRLALTPEQEQQLQPLLEERNAKLRDLWAQHDPNASRREKRQMLSQARAIQQDFTQKIQPILTPEQMKKWEDFRKEAREEAMERYRSRQN